MKTFFYRYLFLGFFLLSSNIILANNLVISSVVLTNDSTLTFNVSWENSWRVSTGINNHDAVWLFVKKRDCASMQWSHVNLSPVVTNHTTAAPLSVYIDGRDGAINAKGVFVRRSANGSGNISSTTVSLRMIGLASGQYDFEVFGIEMVQIPQGSFQVGDGSSTNTFKDGSTLNSFSITSENAITAGTAVGQLSSASFVPVNLPAAYPKGFKEIYCMKYEISQGQYVDFVNTLNSAQGAARQITGTVNRSNITGTWPSIVANSPHRAMNFIAWADLLAYFDWSALRPMTELEFEKVARGTALPVTDEYAWGTSLIVDANTVVTDGTPTEGASNAIGSGNGIANYNNTTVLGPLRCGFAAKPGTSRLEAGSGFYGVMELSGNCDEQVVNTSSALGAGFEANLGDGELTNTPSPGFADVTTWPSQAASIASTTAAVGRGTRGGNWSTGNAFLQVSNRGAATNADGRRLGFNGGRGVR